MWFLGQDTGPPMPPLPKDIWLQDMYGWMDGWI